MEYRQGDTRADGYRFLSYEKRDGRFREKWASPERFAKAIQFMRNYRTNYRKGSQVNPIEDRPTPETDAEAYEPNGSGEWVVGVPFARNLERQKAALREALERTLNWMASYPGGGPMGPTGPYEQARATLAATKPTP